MEVAAVSSTSRFCWFCAMTDSLMWPMIFLGGETEAEWVFERRRLEGCAVALSVISSLHLLLAPTSDKPLWSRHYCQSYHILTMPTTNVVLLTLPWLKCRWNKSSYSIFCFFFAFLCQYQIFTGSGKLSLILPIIMHGVMRGGVKKIVSKPTFRYYSSVWFGLVLEYRNIQQDPPKMEQNLLPGHKYMCTPGNLPQKLALKVT